MLNNNINQLNEQNTLLIKQQLPISSMKDGIIIPFYFNHNRLDSSSILDLLEFKNNLDNSINNALKIINTNRYNNQIVYSKYDYKEPYQHIDFLNRSHPFSYIFEFNENDYLRNSFLGFDLHVYYDQDHDNVNGGINLHLKEINNFSFNNVLKQVYLSNFVEFFIENYLVPEIASIYPNLILAKSLNQNFVHQHSKDVLTLKNHIFSHLVLNWNNLVNEKFDKEDHDFLNNDFFYSLCNVFLLAINFLNVIRLVIINKNSQTFEKLNLVQNNYSTEQKENDFYLLFVLFNTYSDINFKTTKNYKDLTVLNFKEKEEVFKSLKISFMQFYYFHNIVFHDEAKTWISNINENSILSNDNVNEISFIINATLNSEKFMLSIKSKLFISLYEFLEISYAILEDEEFIKENIKNVISSRFYTNNHFAGYNKDNYLLLTFTQSSISEEAKKQLNYFYALAFIYFGASYVAFKELESYSNFVINSGFNHKNFAYRRIIRDLRVIKLDLYQNLYGIDSIKYIVNQVDKQYHLQNKVEHLIEKIRSEDEADKLIVERNSIATAFICALFIGIIWFCDQCYASLQSTGTGEGPVSYPGFPVTTIAMPVIYGFIGLAGFVCFIVTIILAYQCTKLYIVHLQTRNRGLQNVY
ncbi:MAG: hypothetical protein IIT78_01975 [Mycoplasmataceae bacterium]|nr:hypothetical protein [Mycoplasmataceae bacterium]